MVERDSEPLAATVFGDQRAVVMRPLAEDDRAALLAILETGAAEAPVSCPILCILSLSRGLCKWRPSHYSSGKRPSKRIAS
jgi:hypothetical protein